MIDELYNSGHKCGVRLRKSNLDNIKNHCYNIQELLTCPDGMDTKSVMYATSFLCAISDTKMMVKKIMRSMDNDINRSIMSRVLEGKRYPIAKCGDWCPHYGKCFPIQGDDCISLSKRKSSHLVKSVPKNINTISVDTAYKQVDNIIVDLMLEEKSGIVITNTGVGKSHSMIANLLPKTIYCVNSHKFASEIENEIRETHPSFNVVNLCSLETHIKRVLGDSFHDDEHIKSFLKEINFLYSQGNSSSVASLIKTDSRFSSYYDQVNNALASADIIISTQQRMPHLKKINEWTLVIDEDPTNVMITSGSMSKDNLNTILKDLESISDVDSKYSTIHHNITQFLNQSKYIQTTLPLNYQEAANWYSLCAQRKYDGKVGDLAKIQAYYLDWSKDGDGYLYYMFSSSLPNYKNVIILSATINMELAKCTYLKDINIDVYRVDNVEHQGEIVYFSAVTGSKSSQLQSIDNWNTLHDYARETETNIITHGLFTPGNDPIKFGNCSGTNDYKGNDLIIAGTYRKPPWYYALIKAMTSPLPVEFSVITQMKFINYKYENGLTSKFMNFTDHQMANWLYNDTEAEQIQAIGRARLTRCKATIYIFSNIPSRFTTKVVETPFTSLMKTLIENRDISKLAIAA